jgi:hypothetical protein
MMSVPLAALRMGCMKIALRLGLVSMLFLLTAAVVMGCGESDEEKAQTQVCDARSDLKQQVDTLSGLTATTVTTDAVKGALDSIQDDLNQIADAQGDLNDERKQQVESANQEFSSQLKSVAGSLGSSLSLSAAKSQIQDAAKQLASSYQETFAQVDCD